MHAWAVQSSKSFKFRTKKRNTTTIVQQLKLITITNTKMTTKTHLFGALLLLSASSIISTLASVVITEVSDKGTSGVCEENDWIELFNSGADAIDLSDGYILHDDKGPNDPEAFVFPSPTLLGPQEYLLLCNEITTTADPTTLNVGNSQSLPVQVGHPMSPQFGIGGDDTVTLAFIKPEDTTSTTTTNGNTTATTLNAVDRQINPLLYTVISQVRLPNTDDGFDITYALNMETGLYSYTGTPTPGAPNVFTALPTPEEIRARLQTELKAQNDMGTQFFNMDARGDPVPDGMPDVIDMYVTMAPADYQYMLENRTAEQYRPFSGGEVKTVDGELISTFGAGDIRPKGQSSLFLASCLGSDTFPFQLEFNGNSSLYGVKRIYVRNHIGDNSYMRDWSYNRMLAKFGLPYLRARKARFYVNNILHGYYTILEAPDQDYVFHRSFPDFDPENYALFKVKSFALECGAYTQSDIDKAEARLGETSTPPYAFQRGEHKESPPELGVFAIDECIETYDERFWVEDFVDVVLAWLRYDRSCGDMLLEEGLIDRDLGTNDWDDAMHDFIEQDFRNDDRCEVDCANSNLANYVDTDNFLKSFAFYAVTMNADSPLVNGNNYYLAQSGAEAFGGTGGWKIVPYDFNLAEVTYCHGDVCNDRIVHWSIARPTCESLESNNIVGPLLTDETLFSKYLEYVEEFINVAYGNATMIQQMQDHAALQRKYVTPDFWSTFGAFYEYELTPDAGSWEDSDKRFPLLPTMKARTEDVKAQLAAIKDGTFPRGPFVGLNGNNEPLEYCPDWRSEEPNVTSCGGACDYVGCNMPDWTVPHFCDEQFGKCIHGDYDEQCRNLYNGTQYTGMQPMEDGRDAFCMYAKGIPIKAAECPAEGTVKASGAAGTTSAALSFVVSAVVALAAFFGL